MHIAFPLHLFTKATVASAFLLCTAFWVSAQQTSINAALERYQLGEELIFTLQIDNLRYGELFGVVQEKGVMISFTEFITMLDFPIQRQNKEDYVYSGWFINKDNAFELRLYTTARGQIIGEVKIDDDLKLLSYSDVYDFAGERLFDITQMASWFGISTTLDYRDLIIQGKPKVKLPIQLKFERGNRKVFNSSSRTLKYPNYDFGYHWRSHQLIDASVFSQYANDEVRSSYSVIGIQDLAKLSTRFYFSGSEQDALQQAELNFQRQSPEGNLLGPLNATNISFGDILPTRTGGSSSSQSLGVSINNNKLGANYDSDITSIRGLVQNNWDVELYQNDVLIRQANNVSNGRYDFVDIPLFTGLNKFEVRKYGPQGQLEKEQFERNVDGNLFSNAPSYNVSLTRTNSTLLGVSDTDGLANDWNLSGNYGYAVNNWLSTSVGHSLFLGDSDLANSYNISSSARISSRLLGNLGFVYSDTGATSLRASIQSRYFDQNLNISVARNLDADSQESKQFSILMNGNIFSQPWGSVSYTNDYRYSETKNDVASTFFSNGLTFDSRYLTFNHLLNYQNQKSSDGTETESTTGLVALGSRINRVNARLNANYDSTADFQWISYGAGISWKFASKYSTRLAYQKSAISDNESISFGVDWREKSYAINTQLRHDTSSGLNVSVNARFSLSEAPVSQGYLSTDSSLTSDGVVLVRLYEDKNFNFIFDEGDRPLEDVKVTASQFNISAKSDHEGIVKLRRLNSFQNTDLQVDLTTLDDPYLIHSTESTAVTPRTGLLTLVNYPFIQSTEIDGVIVYIDEYGEEKELPYTNVELKNSKGITVASARSEFDGYFYINKIPPGKYVVAIDVESLDSLSLSFNDKVELHLDQPGAFINGVKLTLSQQNISNGFLSYIADFSTVKVANTYLRILKQRSANNPILSNAFLSHDKKSDRYFIGLALFSEDNAAEQLCQQISNDVKSCKIRSHKILY
ncbi:hypothetical protein [Brumicola pallidula]|uniref:SPOR domain-containing protein n=1 Tax=Brumicola pallidula DSM 14239 = ACAM 615 TaxID=1121922 RepID=K7A3R3_9ALTE|nr:hypothetical protein [Glaciecola pallidula]GAC30135.1 hypothetical protein GPAL_3287 [Glaciecola pallidula DSM 14239 = ACAM 615]